MKTNCLLAKRLLSINVKVVRQRNEGNFSHNPKVLDLCKRNAKAMKCKCGHYDWDHYKGKCMGWNKDTSLCECKSLRIIEENKEEN